MIIMLKQLFRKKQASRKEPKLSPNRIVLHFNTYDLNSKIYAHPKVIYLLVRMYLF